MRNVILGIGNILLSDEGIGVRIVEELERLYEFPADVEVLDGGTAGAALYDDIADADFLLLIDACNAGKPPGTIIELYGDEVPVFFRTRISPHQLGISDVLAAMALMDKAPKQIALLGIQPYSLDTGMELSPDMAPKMPDLVKKALEIAARYGVVATSR